LIAISGQISSSSTKSSCVYGNSNRASLEWNNFASVFAVFFPTQLIHRAVINIEISTCFAFSTQAMRLSTDFCLNHSNSNISSVFSQTLKISTRL
jgi:hypothetical protein